MSVQVADARTAAEFNHRAIDITCEYYRAAPSDSGVQDMLAVFIAQAVSDGAHARQLSAATGLHNNDVTRLLLRGVRLRNRDARKNQWSNWGKKNGK